MALRLGAPLAAFAAVYGLAALFHQPVPIGVGLAGLSALAIHFAVACCHYRRLLAGCSTEMARSEQIFLESVKDSTHGMALISAEGKWLRVNSAISRITGYSGDELHKIDFQTITHPDDLGADLHYVKQVLDRKIETYAMEKRYIRKDGKTVWVQLTVSAVWDASGHFCYFISEVRDIDERKRLQEKLLACEAKLRAQ